jgi:hypothetical protein
MASQEILLSTCDRCTTEVRSPLERTRGRRKTELVIPKGWLHVSGNTATSLVFEMDLCEECKNIVMEIAGKARPVHTTTSKAPTTPKKKPETRKKPDEKQAEPEEQQAEGLRLVEAG